MEQETAERGTTARRAPADDPADVTAPGLRRDLIGIGTYTLLWEGSERNPDRLSIAGMIDRAGDLGCGVFQICDDARIEDCDAAELRGLRRRAEQRGVRLELGTRTIDADHLDRYVGIARELGAHLLRSMIQRQEVGETTGTRLRQGADAATDRIRRAVGTLRPTVDRLEESGIVLALETYEQLPTADLIAVVQQLDSPHAGICLDPGNCVSALELPRDVIAAVAPHTANLHVKDFRFERAEGWVGFRFTGARMGEGLLDLDAELEAVYRDGREPSAIVEHWLTWQGDPETTIAQERDWTETTLAALRERVRA